MDHKQKRSKGKTSRRKAGRAITLSLWSTAEDAEDDPDSRRGPEPPTKAVAGTANASLSGSQGKYTKRTEQRKGAAGLTKPGAVRQNGFERN